jgi:exosortase H (IPTLxxWG-CTERM-specific)
VPAAVASARAARRAQLRFFLVFALVAGLGSVLYCFPYAPEGRVSAAIAAYLHVHARLAGVVIGIFDPAVRVSGQDLIGRFSLHISKDCDAMEANILLLGAIVAFPATWARRFAGLAFGMALITATNVIRVCTLYFIGARWPSAFDFAHLELWPLVLVALSVIVFLVWATWTKRPLQAAHASD